ncbi:MAG: hypothetical protein R2813_08540 [Flavobacteriales bacterium]
MNSAYLETSAFYGSILPIYPNFPSSDQHIVGQLALSLRKSSIANTEFGHPHSGIALSYHDFGNKKVFGYGLGLQYQITFEQSLTRKLSVIERFKPGVIYSSKPYHYINNTSNIVFGSHYTALMGISVGLNYRLAPKISLLLEGSLWHASNGHTDLPNVGMNSPMVGLTLRYQLSNSDTCSKPNKCLRYENKFGLIGFSTIGINQAGGTTRPVNGDYYQKYLGGLGVFWRTRSIHRWSLTMETYYDQTYRLWNETQEWASSNNIQESMAVMIMLGHEWLYQRWSLLINGGINIHNPTLDRIITRVESESIANTIKRYAPGRFAIRYYLSHPWKHESSAFVQAGIKSNFGQADFLEFGAGFVISGQKR